MESVWNSLEITKVIVSVLTPLAVILFGYWINRHFWEPVKVGDLEVKPLGVGAGMLGLPGDYSPPSRFVRATALRNTVRPLATGEDAVLEAFRILNNFDIPKGAVDAPGKDILGSTIWTSAMDTKALRYYYRTQYNSRLRVIDLKAIDFGKDNITYVPMDLEKGQDFQKVVIP
ncbi:linear amide C-N hydrolase [Desulfosediminicola sp.]|uniref:linear amide C-N hydrolase n=1 Tax=Desulfosediminicola sp. TaxID=2886825 RepID=UPI003AF1F418